MKNTPKNTRLKNRNSHIFTKNLLVAMLTGGGFLADSLNADEVDSQDSRQNTNQNTNQSTQDLRNLNADSSKSKSRF